MALKKVKYPKKREALLKHYHGEDWTLEDQEQFVRERNTRHCRKSRDNHREAYTTYQKEYQRKYRERNKYHYGFVLWNKNHPDEPMTEDEYVAYRKQKERKRKMQEKKMNYDEEAYQRDVDKWFEELKDIITNDLLWQHINKYPVKSDYEIKEEDENKDSDDSKE